MRSRSVPSCSALASEGGFRITDVEYAAIASFGADEGGGDEAAQQDDGRQAARDGGIMRRWCDGGMSDARQPVGALGEPDPMFANAQTDPERPATLSPRWLDTPI